MLIHQQPDGVRLFGEADLGVTRELEEALAPLVRGTGDIVIDITELEFMDASVAGLLTSTAEALPEPRRLVLVHPCRLVSRVLCLLGVDRLPRVQVRPRGDPS